jgi:hypothetical protein
MQHMVAGIRKQQQSSMMQSVSGGDKMAYAGSLQGWCTLTCRNRCLQQWRSCTMHNLLCWHLQQPWQQATERPLHV